MNNISNFLSKFKNIILSDENIKEKTSEAVFNALNIKVEKESIKFSEGIINIKASPLVKSEIFMKKDVIIKEINSLLEKEIVRDIR